MRKHCELRKQSMEAECTNIANQKEVIIYEILTSNNMPTSITVVQADGTIYTATTFTLVTPPTPEQTIDIAPGESVDVVAEAPVTPPTA